MKTRGLGRIYPRGNVWWIQYCFRGKVKRESAKTGGAAGTKRDALTLLRKRHEEMGRGRLVGPDVERTMLADLKRILLDDYRANGRRSLARAEAAWAPLAATFPDDSRALDVTLDRLNAYVAARRAAGRQAATALRELATLRRAFRLAERAGKAVCPPFPTVSVQNARTGFFERPASEAVRDRLPDALRPLATFLYLTGWRKGEALALTWDRVDFAAGTLRLEPGTTKNAEGRTFPFAALPDLADLLRRQRLATVALDRRTGQVVPWVFHRAGRPILHFRGAWRKACEAAGCPERIPHDFRRTAVRNLERAGVPRSVAMKLTGHKTEAVYRRYAIVAEADLAEGVKKLAALQAVDAEARRAAADAEGLARAAATESFSTVLTQNEHKAPLAAQGPSA